MTSTLLGVLLVVFAGALPVAAEDARPTSVRAHRCATVDALAATRARGATAIFAQERPAMVGSTVSETFPVRVHWQADSFAARADVVMGFVEAAYQAQVTDQGYRAPLPDDGEGGEDFLDVYLVNSPGIAGLTVASEDVDDGDGAHAAYVHILINALLSDLELEVTISHEFAHAIHFATDRSESLMFFEASAVWQEIHAVPSSTLWTQNIEPFQHYANAPFSTDGIAWRTVSFNDTLYEYGAVLFLMYLEEVHGENDGALLRSLWDASVQADTVDENEPDWLDALAALPAIDRSRVIADFAEWRSLVGAWRRDDDGPRLSAALGTRDEVPTRRISPAALNGGPILFLPIDSPFPTGCTWVSTTAPENREIDLVVTASSERDSDLPRDLAFVALRGFPPGAVERIPPVFGESTSTTLTLAAGESLRYGVCDLTPFDADGLGEPHPIVMSLYDTSLPAFTPDAGVPTEQDAGDVDGGGEPDNVPPNCGCQAASRRGGGLPGGGPWGRIRPYLMGLGLLLGAYMAFARFRRSARARKSIKGTSWKEQRDASVAKAAAKTVSAESGKEPRPEPHSGTPQKTSENA